ILYSSALNWLKLLGAKLLESPLLRSRVERNLQRGDLRALSDFAFFRHGRPPSAVVERLRERGFLAKTERGRPRMTLKGWIAVSLRHTIARRDRTETPTARIRTRVAQQLHDDVFETHSLARHIRWQILMHNRST